MEQQCAHCGEPGAQRECGADCGTPYCGEQCADAHWLGDEAHWEFCGRAAGHGSANKKWIQGMHLKKGALTKTAKAHHMTTKGFERWVDEHPNKVSDTTRRRVAWAETAAKFHHGGSKK
jgi:hypothetical protein